MNKRGFSLFFGMMMFIVFIVLGLALAPAIKSVTGEAKNNEALNCSTTTDNQTKSVCYSIDAMMLFILVIWGLAGFVLGGVLG